MTPHLACGRPEREAEPCEEDDLERRIKRSFWLWFGANPIFWAILVAHVLVASVVGLTLTFMASWMWLADRRWPTRRSYRSIFNDCVDLHREWLVK